jgi:hypothetical protein
MKKEHDSAGRSFVAGAVGGVVAVVAMATLAAVLMRRLGPRMMQRMMSCCDSDEMCACMESCGCGKAAERDADVAGAAEAQGGASDS